MDIKALWKALFGGEEESKSASIAKDRLKVIVASSERLNTRLSQSRIDEMKREILAVVNKFVSGVQIDDVNIKQRNADSLDVLELSINLPDK